MLESRSVTLLVDRRLWPSLLMTVTTACNRCQTPLESGARFCQVCGLSVSGEQTAPLPTLMQVLRQGTLGEYEIMREIGQGGMATVFLAHEIALDRKVAIKVMSPQFVHGADMIERFVQYTGSKLGEKILNDYSSLGRGEARPRQPSREIYGRMDVSIASADDRGEHIKDRRFDEHESRQQVLDAPRYRSQHLLDDF